MRSPAGMRRPLHSASLVIVLSTLLALVVVPAHPARAYNGSASARGQHRPHPDLRTALRRVHRHGLDLQVVIP